MNFLRIAIVAFVLVLSASTALGQVPVDAAAVGGATAIDLDDNVPLNLGDDKDGVAVFNGTDLEISSAGDLSFGAKIDTKTVTIDTLGSCGTDTVTVVVDKVTSTCLEGTDWTAETSNDVSAGNLATCLNGKSGISATASSAVVTVTHPLITTIYIKLSIDDATCATVSNGTDGEINIYANVVVTGNTCAKNSAGPCMLDEAASSANPVFVPNRTNLTDGIGSDSFGITILTGNATRLSIRDTLLIVGAGLDIRFSGSDSVIFDSVEAVNIGTAADSSNGLIVGDAVFGGSTEVKGSGFVHIGLTVGNSFDDLQPTFSMIGDADSDGAGDTSETLLLTLTPNADPTLATWGFTSTQSDGYTFDKKVTTGSASNYVSIVHQTDGAVRSSSGLLGLAGSIATKTFQVIDYTACEDDVLTIVVNGTTNTCTENDSPSSTQWNAVTSNDQSATNLEVCIEAITGLDATVSTNTVTVTHPLDTTLRVFLSDVDSVCITTVNGNDGSLNLYGATVYSQVTIKIDDTTPSISGGFHFVTSANTGATAITDLDDGKAGQYLMICGGSNTNKSTIADSGNFSINGAMTLGLDDCLTLFVQADNDYVEVSRSNVVTPETFHAEMAHEGSGNAFTISGQTDHTAFHDANTAIGDAAGWTFEAGGGPFAVSEISDSSGDLLVTSATHGLAVGDIVSMSDCTDTGYDAIYDVLTVPTSTTFTAAGTFAATDAACQVDHAAALVASTGSAGDYVIMWAASATAQTNNDVFEFMVHVNTSDISGRIERKFGIAADIGAMSGVFIATIADADRIGFFIINSVGTGNITLKHFSVVIRKL